MTNKRTLVVASVEGTVSLYGTKGPNIVRTYLSVPILTGPSPANSGTLGS